MPLKTVAALPTFTQRAVELGPDDDDHDDPEALAEAAAWAAAAAACAGLRAVLARHAAEHFGFAPGAPVDLRVFDPFTQRLTPLHDDQSLVRALVVHARPQPGHEPPPLSPSSPSSPLHTSLHSPAPLARQQPTPTPPPPTTTTTTTPPAPLAAAPEEPFTERKTKKKRGKAAGGGAVPFEGSSVETSPVPGPLHGPVHGPVAEAAGACGSLNLCPPTSAPPPSPAVVSAQAGPLLLTPLTPLAAPAAAVAAAARSGILAPQPSRPPARAELLARPRSGSPRPPLSPRPPHGSGRLHGSSPRPASPRLASPRPPSRGAIDGGATPTGRAGRASASAADPAGVPLRVLVWGCALGGVTGCGLGTRPSLSSLSRSPSAQVGSAG